MKTNHTQGEWSISVDQFDNYNIISNGHYLGEARTKADAQLIAAAPDLLNACQSLVNYFEMDYVLNGKIVDNPPNFLITNYEIAKEAINKATHEN